MESELGRLPCGSISEVVVSRLETIWLRKSHFLLTHSDHAGPSPSLPPVTTTNNFPGGAHEHKQSSQRRLPSPDDPDEAATCMDPVQVNAEFGSRNQSDPCLFANDFMMIIFFVDDTLYINHPS
jgi:hypothetical protein